MNDKTDKTNEVLIMKKYANLDLLFEKHNEVMTVRELAQTLRCSDSHILDVIHSGELPCFRIGRHYRVCKKDVLVCAKKAYKDVEFTRK